MGIRQVRGVYPGLLDQESPEAIARHYLTDLPPEGRAPRAGLITAPIAGEVVETGMGDPIIHDIRTGQEELQSGDETKQAAQQAAPEIPPWLIIAGLIAAAL